jgi:hypothetical protein
VDTQDKRVVNQEPQVIVGILVKVDTVLNQAILDIQQHQDTPAMVDQGIQEAE